MAEPKIVTDKLRAFIKESKWDIQLATMNEKYGGLYTEDIYEFIDCFEQYLETGENKLEEMFSKDKTTKEEQRQKQEKIEREMEGQYIWRTSEAIGLR